MKKLKSQYITKDSSSRMHSLEVPIIGLTGGIATGKSSCSKILVEQGYPVICADHLIKTIYKQVETVQFIEKTFPEAISGGEIDFKKLREIAFSAVKNRETLENFLYQKLPATFKDEYQKLGSPEFVIYDVPLLFEKGLDQNLDQIITVYAPRTTQIERLVSRDNISKELAEKMLGEQIDIEKKKSKSNFVIENTKEFSDLEAICLELFSQLICSE